MDDLTRAALRRVTRATVQAASETEASPRLVYQAALGNVVMIMAGQQALDLVEPIVEEALDYAYAPSWVGREHPVNGATGRYMHRLGTATPAIVHVFLACAVGFAHGATREESRAYFLEVRDTVRAAFD